MTEAGAVTALEKVCDVARFLDPAVGTLRGEIDGVVAHRRQIDGGCVAHSLEIEGHMSQPCCSRFSGDCIRLADAHESDAHARIRIAGVWLARG